MKHKIKGTLNGNRKSVVIEAPDEISAMNKLASQYPDFEFDQTTSPTESQQLERIEHQLAEINKIASKYTDFEFDKTKSSEPPPNKEFYHHPTPARGGVIQEYFNPQLSGDTPESFIKSCGLFISLIRVIGYIVAAIYLGNLTMGYAGDPDVEMVIISAGFLWVVGLAIAFVLIEAQVLVLRFLRHVIKLLNRST